MRKSIELLPEQKYVLTLKEAAAYFNIGEKALRRLAEIKELHLAMMFGNKWLFIRKQVEMYMVKCASENDSKFKLDSLNSDEEVVI